MMVITLNEHLEQIEQHLMGLRAQRQGQVEALADLYQEVMARYEQEERDTPRRDLRTYGYRMHLRRIEETGGQLEGIGRAAQALLVFEELMDTLQARGVDTWILELLED